jgi:hypothetical protein
MIILDDFEKGSCRSDPAFPYTECEMYQDILDAKGRENFRKVVTDTHGFTTDVKILTGVIVSILAGNSIL